MGNKVIYSIDNVSSLRSIAKFTSHMDKSEAGNKTTGKTVPCIGSFDGVLEVSFISTEEDYRNHVLPYGFVSEQCSILLLENNQVFACAPDLTEHECLGRMKQGVKNMHGWTYRMDQDVYYSTE